MANIQILDLEVKKIVQLTNDEQYLIQGGLWCPIPSPWRPSPWSPLLLINCLG